MNLGGPEISLSRFFEDSRADYYPCSVSRFLTRMSSSSGLLSVLLSATREYEDVPESHPPTPEGIEILWYPSPPYCLF